MKNLTVCTMNFDVYPHKPHSAQREEQESEKTVPDHKGCPAHGDSDKSKFPWLYVDRNIGRPFMIGELM